MNKKKKRERVWICFVCKDIFTKEDIRCWKQMHEEFNTHPLICPDCLAAFNEMTPEKQILYLMGEAHVIGNRF